MSKPCGVDLAQHDALTTALLSLLGDILASCGYTADDSSRQSSSLSSNWTALSIFFYAFAPLISYPEQNPPDCDLSFFRFGPILPPVQNSLPALPAATFPPPHLSRPPHQLIAPPPAHEHPTHHIHHPHHQRQQASPFFADRQQDGLDVELEEDAGDLLLAHHARLRSHGVLIRENGVGRGEVGRGAGAAGIDGRYHRKVVLVFEEVGGRRGQSSVEGVEEGGIEGSEGELVDDVREIESWTGSKTCQCKSFKPSRCFKDMGGHASVMVIWVKR